MPRRNQGPRLRWLAKRKCFYIVWTEHGRSRERSTCTAEREQAEIVFAEWLQRRGRRAGTSDPTSVLVTDVLNEYQEQRGPKVAAPARIAYAVLALTDFFESNSVGDVTPQTCGRYVEKRGCSAGTARRELGVLRAAINYAHRSGRITRPVAVELPEPPQPRDRWLTRKEAARLLRACRTAQGRLYMPLFVLLGLYTGRRKEALLSLRWPQVNLEAGTINFEISGRRRTNKRRGVARIPSRLLPHLERAWKRGSELGYVLHINGERIGDIKRGFAAACRRAGLSDVTPHTLRHTAATWLMQAGTVASVRLPFNEHGNLASRVRASSSRLSTAGGGEHRPASAERPRNRMMFRLRSAQLQTRNPHEFGANLMMQSSPKAEVRGSNPFGRATKSMVDRTTCS
jgi:integrase